MAVGMLICTQLTQAAAIVKDRPFDLNNKTGRSTDGRDTLNKEVIKHDPSWYLNPKNIPLQLDSLQGVIPLTYNGYVQSYIDAYASSRYRNHLAKMASLAAYYFPIYEKVFAEVDIPTEIKYLSIIESALNPHAVSRVGATGPWQFMFGTAKAFNLNIDSYVDERKDPYAASYAAAAYLKDAYNEFGDWQLAIASYNCGKGNVERAIQRSGLAKPDFWSIRRYLPSETRNYVPAYIAMTYVLNNLEGLGISPTGFDAAPEGTDVISIDKFIPLSGVARALNVELSRLEILNPAYKKNIINGTPESPKRLVVPTVDKAAYASLYAVLNNPNNPSSAAPQMMTASTRTQSNVEERLVYHKVRRGESLGMIANRYHVEVQDLKVWNKLKRNLIVPGQRLKIAQMVKSSGQPTVSANNTSSQATPKRYTGPSYISYKVKKGDTISSIAQKYKKATVRNIKAMNNLSNDALRPGMVLKINNL